MNRLSRFRRSVVSGYAVLGANVLYSLASVPIALHYLGTEEFGLWAMAMQLAGYLQLIDLGMSGAISRILIDHKDEPAGGEYGGILKTGMIVLGLQALIVAVAGCAIAFVFAGYLNVDHSLVPTFRNVFCWLSLSTALGFATKLASHILTAHQRNDLINYSHVGLFAISFAVLWLGFHAGLGVYSLALASTAGVLLSAAIAWWACHSLRLFPERGAWGKVRASRIKELFLFGKDLFLLALGTQLVMASQTILITQVLGLQAAATWSVCTRVYSMLSLFVWRPFDMSCPALSEMAVRGETGRIRHRFRSLVILTLSLSAAAAVVFATLNQAFVSVWTQGRIAWPVSNDLLLGMQLIIISVVHCHCSFPGIIKQIGAMRYVYFLEGFAFVLLGYFTTGSWGMTGTIVAALICAVCASGAYGLCRTRTHFDMAWVEVLWRWNAPAARVLALAAPLAFGTWYATQPLAPVLRLVVGMVFQAPLCAMIFLRFGLERELRVEFVAHVPPGFRRVTGLVLGTV